MARRTVSSGVMSMLVMPLTPFVPNRDREPRDSHTKDWLTVDPHALAHPHAVTNLEALDVEADEAVEHMTVGVEEGIERPDVGPVAILQDAAEQRLALLQQRREDVLREVDLSVGGDVVEDLG